METLYWKDHTVYLLDQTLLPGREVFHPYTDYRAVTRAIRDMVVRGAPAIGIAAAYAYVLAALEYRSLPQGDFARSMGEAAKTISLARPTAVNLFWALGRMEQCLDALPAGADPIGALLEEALAIHREDVEMNRLIGRLGAGLVPQNAGVLTHCNAGALATGGYGTALGVIRAAHTQGKVKMVYADETRPLLQGARLTAYELAKDGIPVTLITDNMAGAMMAAGHIHMVVLGCDRMARNGDFANKIGTYSLAVLANYHGIPFYTALPVSSIDLSIADGSEIVVEERLPEEVLGFGGARTAPEGVAVRNPAFDVTPHSLITGIITDRGVLYPPFKERLEALFSKA